MRFALSGDQSRYWRSREVNVGVRVRAVDGAVTHLCVLLELLHVRFVEHRAVPRAAGEARVGAGEDVVGVGGEGGRCMVHSPVRMVVDQG